MTGVCKHLHTMINACMKVERHDHLLEDVADPMIDPDHLPGNGRQALPEEEVRGKHADEREVLLAAEAHDGEGCLHAASQILVLWVLHPGCLLSMLGQGAQQPVLIAAAFCHVALHSCGHLGRHDTSVCSDLTCKSGTPGSQRHDYRTTQTSACSSIESTCSSK